MAQVSKGAVRAGLMRRGCRALRARAFDPPEVRANQSAARRDIIAERLADRGIDATLLAPDTCVGMTPENVGAIRRVLQGLGGV